MCAPDFAQTYQTKQVQMEVLDLIECFTGVLDGCTLANLTDLSPLINPLFEEVVKLVDIYHNYSVIVSAVFQIFCVTAKRISCALNEVCSAFNFSLKNQFLFFYINILLYCSIMS